jgi:hypothetical protein
VTGARVYINFVRITDPHAVAETRFHVIVY